MSVNVEPQVLTRAADNILQAVMDNVPEGITIAFGTDAVIHSVSKRGLEILEKPGEELTAIAAWQHPDAWEVYHQDQTTKVAAPDLPLTRACHGEHIEGEELFIRSSTGRLFPILCNAGPIKDPHGEVIGGIIAWRDNTVVHDLIAEKEVLAAQAEAARCEAEKANRSKDLFLAKLSHELRSPLAAVIAWTDAAEKRIDDPATVQKALEVIKRNTELQTKLIDDLLDLNRIAAGKLELRLSSLQLDEVVQTALDSLVVLPRERATPMDVDLVPITMQGDPGRLHQVVTNLISNAVKFSEPGHPVRVTLEQIGDSAQLCVMDSGQGLAAEDLPMVFEPFWQGGKGSYQRGLGLGLSIVRTLVEMHGGEVCVTSDGPGRGCCFKVTLPLNAAESGRPPEGTSGRAR